MVRPAPISLKLRPDEVTARARVVLHRLDDDLRLQNSVKLLAMKAYVLINKMNAVAEPRLKLLATSDRGRWQTEIKLVESILLKISKRGA